MKTSRWMVALLVVGAVIRPNVLICQAGVLFAAAPDRGATDLRPIVRVMRSAGATRYSDLTLEARTSAAKAGRWYRFSGTGILDSIRFTGTLTAGGCSEVLHGRATLPQGIAGTRWHGVAGDVPGLQTGIITDRPPTSEEWSAITDVARRQARGIGIRAKDLTSLEWLSTSIAVLPAGDTILAATWKLYHPAIDSVTGAELAYTRDGSGHLVLEGGPGRWRRTLGWAKDNEEAGERRQWAVLIDLDGDSIPEMVTSTFYYESDDFQVFTHSSAGWRIVWRGGAEGC